MADTGMYTIDPTTGKWVLKSDVGTTSTGTSVMDSAVSNQGTAGYTPGSLAGMNAPAYKSLYTIDPTTGNQVLSEQGQLASAQAQYDAAQPGWFDPNLGTLGKTSQSMGLASEGLNLYQGLENLGVFGGVSTQDIRGQQMKGLKTNIAEAKAQRRDIDKFRTGMAATYA